MCENAFDKQVLVFLVDNYFASVKLFQIFTPLINSLCFKDIKTIQRPHLCPLSKLNLYEA